MKKSIAIILSIMLVLAITFQAAALSTVAVKSIKLNKTSISMKVGQTYNLKATFTPANTTQKSLTYVTGNKKIATVNTAGKITGVSKGTTTITVYTLNKKIFAKCNVNISQLDAEAFKISVASWQFADTEIDRGMIYKGQVIKVFKTKYPNAVVEWNNIPSEKYFDILKAKLASNSAEDVFFHQDNGQSNLGSLAKAGYLADLSNQPWVPDMIDAANGYVKYQGKVYAAPWSVGGWGCWYNKKIFADLGLSIPKNWGELMNTCEKIKTAGITPFIGGFKDSWTLMGYFLDMAPTICNDPDFELNIYKGIKKINGPEYKKMFTLLESMVQKGYFNKNCLSIGWDQTRVELGTGKGAILFQGNFLPGMMTTEYKDVEIGFMPIPDENGKYILSSGVGALVSANAQAANLERAFDLVSACVNKTAQTLQMKNTAVSAFKGVNIEYTSVGNKEYSDALNKYTTVAQHWRYLPGSCTEVLTKIATKILAGQKFNPADLDEAQNNYDKDKSTIVVPIQ